MKAIFISLALAMFTLVGYSQNQIGVENGTGCDYIVQMYGVPAGNCVAAPAVTNYFVSGYSWTMTTAPAGYEWIYTEVTSFPFCGGGSYGQAVGADVSSGCVGCTWGVPTTASGPTYGCNGCQPTVNLQWYTCKRILHIY